MLKMVANSPYMQLVAHTSVFCDTILIDLFTDCEYGIKVKTGDQDNAGTDAAVTIKLYGSSATCGWRLLDTPGNHTNDFEKGR